jgi:hypothetical protein
MGRCTIPDLGAARRLLAAVSLAALVCPSATPARSQVAAIAPAPLGVTYSGWKGGFVDAPRRLQIWRQMGFPLVGFVPAYAYVGLDRLDLGSGPGAGELGRAVETALRTGFEVVIKPHLEPASYQPGYDRFTSNDFSWRANCPWRGFFDLDPMTADYREGVVFASLRMLKEVFDRLGPAVQVPPVRFELGVELMTSEVDRPGRWERLLADARRERRRLGLERRVLMSHNFTHHIEIPEDFVARMDGARRRALARYIKGLDALSLSQYMDLTVAVPREERARRLPTADEVAQALVRHERDFRHDILGKALGLAPSEIPPLHIGEFGVGRGGLKHPNLYDGDATPAGEKALAQQIARGHEGLVRYLALPAGRTARSAILWVTGEHYDIFGWQSPTHAIPQAAAAIEAGLAAYRNR